MRANVRAVPVEVMRKKDRARLMFRQNVRDYLDRLPPVCRLLRAGSRVDFLQPVRRGLHQAEADALAAVLQFLEPFCLPLLLAPLRDGDVDDVQLRLAQQAQSQPADDDFIVRVRGEYQNSRRVRRRLWSRQRRGLTQGTRPALLGEAGVFGNEMVVRSEEHTSELQSRGHLVCRLLLEKKKRKV